MVSLPGVMWNIVCFRFQIDFVLHSLPEAFAEVKQRADKAYVHLCVYGVCVYGVCVCVCVYVYMCVCVWCVCVCV